MKFSIMISYTQLNLYNANEPAFLLWNDLHTQQGFAWRDGTVSFGFPDDGESYIEVTVVDEYPPIEQGTFRVIRVPFEVRSKAHLATITDDYQLNVEKGIYSLEFRLSSGEKSPDKNTEYDYFTQLF